MASKKEALKDIIRALHGGLSVEDAKKRFQQDVGTMSTSELVETEQSLIEEGLPPEEVARFCNVHVALVEAGLEQKEPTGEPAPLRRLRLDNAAIRGVTAQIRRALQESSTFEGSLANIIEGLENLPGVDRHYMLKENSIFPHLERHGFPGPSKVMWQKDNEIRAMMKAALKAVADINSGEKLGTFMTEHLEPLLEEIDGMVTKEEDILFPAAVERLSARDWAMIDIEIDEVGLAFASAEGPGDRAAGAPDAETEGAAVPAPATGLEGGMVHLPSGSVAVKELLAILNNLPVDVTFVDKDDTFRYFSEQKERIFVRTRSSIGRAVQNCHPPKSIDAVQKILDSFRDGSRDSYEFWLPMGEKFVYIRYIALRADDGEYLGTLEVTQDIAPIQKIEGEKRLADG